MIQSKVEDDMSICMFLEQIPLDLIIDILLRLPAKSTVRFRCVSKLWSSILTRPDFIKSFSIQSSTRLCLLVCFKMRSNKRLFLSLPQQHEQPDKSLSHQHYGHLQRYQIKTPEGDDDGICYTPLSESVHGLLLFGFYVGPTALWNPNMRQQVILPELRHKGCFLGYDPVERKYKVLFIAARAYRKPLVCTLGPQESWRVIQNSPKHRAPYFNSDAYSSVYINGYVYYQADVHYDIDGNISNCENEEIVMRFDVRYEKFNIIRKPDDHTLGTFMLKYKGKLAWFCSYDSYDSSYIRFWVLEDEEKQEWSLRKFLFPVWKDVNLYLCGITHDTGEFIFVEPQSNAIYVLYYDPNKNRMRRIVYEGFRDDKDFENFRSKYVEFYPNHCESLCSLENVPCNMSPVHFE